MTLFIAVGMMFAVAAPPLQIWSKIGWFWWHTEMITRFIKVLVLSMMPLMPPRALPWVPSTYLYSMFGYWENIAAYKWNKGLGSETTSYAVGTSSDTAATIDKNQHLNFGNGAETVSLYMYDAADGTSIGMLASTNDDFGFVQRLNDNGSYAGFNQDYLDGQMSLNDGDLTFYMYQYDKYEADMWYLSAEMSLELNETTGVLTKGAVSAEYDAPVPVPGAIWLLGSALLGFVGLRKKYLSKISSKFIV